MTQGDLSTNGPCSILELRWAERPGGVLRTQVRFLDFVIDGQSVLKHLGSPDYVTPLGWFRPSFQKVILEELQLLAQPDLPEGRQVLYVCPECGDLGCGAISAVVLREGVHVVWKDFAYYSPDIFENDQGWTSPTIERDEYEEIGPFVFDAGSYMSLFQELGHLLQERPNALEG